MARTLEELQDAGVEPDVWKVEGLTRPEDCRSVAAMARRGGRSRVGLIVLGRGEDEDEVRMWLLAAAGVTGFVGFAVGRTTFWEALVRLRAGEIPREAAVAEIARRYRAWVDVYQEAQGRDVPAGASAGAGQGRAPRS
jgi:5-dehydro-2-deoxygluconokinase